MDLAVQKREIMGKANRGLRKKGFIPAELYGHGVPNVHLQVPVAAFEKVFKEAGENMVVNVVLGAERHSVVIHDIDRDYISGDVRHIDFYEVRMDEKMKVHIPIEFVGEAPAVKNFGGFLNKTLTSIEVEALPADLPHSLSVDLSVLAELNASVYVKDMAVPKNVKLLLPPEAVVATVTPPVVEEKVEAPVDVTEVKVESEEKKAERALEKEKAGETESAEKK